MIKTWNIDRVNDDYNIRKSLFSFSINTSWWAFPLSVRTIKTYDKETIISILCFHLTFHKERTYYIGG